MDREQEIFHDDDDNHWTYMGTGNREQEIFPRRWWNDNRKNTYFFYQADRQQVGR